MIDRTATVSAASPESPDSDGLHATGFEPSRFESSRAAQRACAVPDSTPLTSWLALAVLVAVSILAGIDQVILSIGTEPMRKALALTDVQIGLLQGLGLTLAAAFGSVPLAWLADRFDRRRVLAGCIVFWSAATAARGWGHSFRDIMASTSGLALAEAGLVPIVFAMIPTLFRPRHRPAANIVFYAATALGSSFALILGGGAFAAIEAHADLLPEALKHLESWRTSSFAVAVLGPAFAVLVLTIKKDGIAAQRPAGATRHAKRREFSLYLKENWRSLMGVYGAAALAAAGLGPLVSWLPVAVSRRFGLSPAQIGVQLGVTFVSATVIGLIFSAALQRLFRQRLGQALPLYTGRYLTLLSALPVAVLAFSDSLVGIYVAIFLVVTCFVAFNATMPSLYQGIAPGALRARVTAAGFAVCTVASTAGAIAVGYLSSVMTSQRNGLLDAACAIAAPLLLLSAASLYCVRKHAVRTLEEVQRLEINSEQSP